MPRLDDLPNELLELICRYLDNEDLKHLSLASQGLKPIPRRVLFEDFDVILWKDEWDDFKDFVRHGADLHGHVRKLRFHVQSPMQEEFDENEFNDWIENHAERDSSDGSLYSMTTEERRTYRENEADDRAADLGLRRLSHFEKWQKERLELKRTLRLAFNPRTLPRTLRKFPNLGSVMLISDGLGNDRAVEFGFAKRPSTYSFDHLSLFDEEMFVNSVPDDPKGRWINEYSSNPIRYIAYDVLRPFLSSLTSERVVALKELHIGEINPFHPDLSEPLSTDFLDWRLVLESVEKLSLFFTAAIVYPVLGRYSGTRRLEGPTNPEQIAIQASSSLRELCVGWHQNLPLDQIGFTCFARSKRLFERHFPSLRSLSLCGFEVNVKDFQDFLGRHRRTLTQLHLHNILLICPDGELRPTPEGSYLRDADEHVKEFLIWMVQNMDFQRVELSGLFWAVQRRPLQADWTPPNEFDMDEEPSGAFGTWTDTKVAKTVGLQLGRAIATAEPPCIHDTESDSSGYDGRAKRRAWVEGFFRSYEPFMALGPDQMPSPPQHI